jgi:hypothetical protein
MTRKKKNNKTKSIKRKRYNLAAVFDKHIKHEFQDHDVDATMKTMVREPYVHHVPVLQEAWDMIASTTILLVRCQMTF